MILTDMTNIGDPQILLQGEITSPINPPNECRFAKRCPHASAECKNGAPALREVSPGHFVACCKCGQI